MIDPLHGHTQSLLDRSSLEPAGELGRSRSTSRRDLWGSLGRGGLRSGISQETSQHPTRKMLDMTAARTRFANWRANMVDGSIRNSSMNHFALRGVQDLNCWEHAEPDKRISGPFPLQIPRKAANPHRGEWRLGHGVFRWSFPTDWTRLAYSIREVVFKAGKDVFYTGDREVPGLCS